MNKPVLAILLEFGFHEIKKYIHSGFAQKLGEQFNIVWFAIDKKNMSFDTYFKNTGFLIEYFKSDFFENKYSKLESYNQSVRRAWMIKNNKGIFHNYQKVNTKTGKNIFLGNSLLKWFFEQITLYYVKRKYYDNRISSFLEKHNVQYLLSTGYSSTFSKTAFVTAHKKKLKTFYLVNSWKDLFSNNFLPFRFLDNIFVWSEEMKKNYLDHMGYLNSKKIIVSGNPTFDVIINKPPTFDKEYYAQKYKIDKDAIWILYTMMPPGLVNDEIETIKLIAIELLKNYPPKNLCILIRKNPNHEQNDFSDILLPINSIFVEHYCTFDKENDMIVQSYEGEQEWLDLIYYTDMNLSVPSTVTLEFLTMGKPLINIGFGPNGKKDERLSQFFESGFYKPMFNNDLVNKIENISEFNKTFQEVLDLINFNSPHFCNVNDEFAANKILKILNNENIIYL